MSRLLKLWFARKRSKSPGVLPPIQSRAPSCPNYKLLHLLLYYSSVWGSSHEDLSRTKGDECPKIVHCGHIPSGVNNVQNCCRPILPTFLKAKYPCPSKMSKLHNFSTYYIFQNTLLALTHSRLVPLAYYFSCAL